MYLAARVLEGFYAGLYIAKWDGTPKQMFYAPVAFGRVAGFAGPVATPVDTFPYGFVVEPDV
jgi:hypothetical protein